MRIATITLLSALAGCAPRSAAGGMSTIEDSTSAGGDVTRAGFDDLDVNADEELDGREFFEVAEVHYDLWDQDEDGELTSGELVQGIFASWDRNRDGRIGPSEHEAGVVSWVPDDLDRGFASWDRDMSGALDREELRTGLASARVFERYDADADGVVTDLEFSDLMFHYWDTDGDDAVDALEWRID